MNCPKCGHIWNGSDSADCPACAAEQERQLELRPWIQSLGAQVAAVQPPAGLEAAVLAEFDANNRQRRGATRQGWYVSVGGAVAACLLAGALLVRHAPPAPASAAAQHGASEAQTFLPIPYTPPLLPYERVLVVQTDVPVTALIAAGFRVQTSDPGASVRADVMVSQDGRPRAIRPILFNASDRRAIP